MANVSLLICNREAPDFSGTDPKRDAIQFLKGDIINAYPSNTVATRNGAVWNITGNSKGGTTSWVHVTDVPTARAVNLRNRIKEAVERVALMEETNEHDTVLQRRCRFRLPRGNLTAPERNALNTDGEITITFGRLLEVMERKNVTSDTDRSTDTVRAATGTDFD